MVDSILTSIKGLVGVTPSDTNFDNEIIIHINSAFMALQQPGVGPARRDHPPRIARCVCRAG